MPVVNGRLTCCVCGADLGDAADPYRDPDCQACFQRELDGTVEAEQVEFSETPEGYDARAKWARAYDELNGAPENDGDR